MDEVETVKAWVRGLLALFQPTVAAGVKTEATRQEAAFMMHNLECALLAATVDDVFIKKAIRAGKSPGL